MPRSQPKGAEIGSCLAPARARCARLRESLPLALGVAPPKRLKSHQKSLQYPCLWTPYTCRMRCATVYEISRLGRLRASLLECAPEMPAQKVQLNFLLCCRCCQALLRLFFSPCNAGEALCPLASRTLAASYGVGTHGLPRPALRAGVNTGHPLLSASCDERRQAWRRRPHLSDGFLARPGS